MLRAKPDKAKETTKQKIQQKASEVADKSKGNAANLINISEW